MSARKKLYEITTIEGEVVEPSISIQELRENKHIRKTQIIL